MQFYPDSVSVKITLKNGRSAQNKCTIYTIYLKCSFLKNIKTLKTAANRQTKNRVQRYSQNYVKVRHPPPPYGSAKSMVQTVVSEKKEKFKKIKFSKFEKNLDICDFCITFALCFSCDFLILGCCRCETAAIFVCDVCMCA